MEEKFEKVAWKPGTLLTPVPAVMVSCGNEISGYNIITIAWTGIINSKPPMTYVSIRPERYSHKLIKESGEFVINITTRDLARATDWCGVKSGKDYDKFKEMSLNPAKAQQVSAPLIAESPLNLECKVSEIKEFGSHDMFIAEIVSVNATKAYIDDETGKFHIENSDPIAYMHGHYYNIGKRIGGFGHTVMKKSTRKKRQQKDNNK